MFFLQKINLNFFHKIIKNGTEDYYVRSTVAVVYTSYYTLFFKKVNRLILTNIGVF